MTADPGEWPRTALAMGDSPGSLERQREKDLFRFFPGVQGNPGPHGK